MEDQIKDLMSHASADMAADKQKQKLCLIQDIIKAKQLLYVWGDVWHSLAINDPAAEFDHLYEKSLEDLQGIDKRLTKKVNETIQLKFKKHGQ